MATYTPLQSVTLTSAAASVTFSNIDQTYTDLIMTITSCVTTGNGYTLRFQVGNGSVDSGGNYSWTQLVGDGSSVTTGRYSGSNPQNQYMYGGRVDNSPNFGVTTAHFMNYSNTLYKKSALIKGGVSSVRDGVTANLWSSTAAINIITVSNEAAVNFAPGSTFHLYGLRAGGTAKASGGDIIATDGTYWYHAFLKTGRFTPAIPNLSCDILTVAGGGGASGSYASAGGGGGGYLTYSSQVLSTVTQTVIVGAGGAGGPNSNYYDGFDGSSSQFGSLTAAVGGGAGAAGGYNNGHNGGSGGGSWATKSGGTGIVGQGHNGATGSTDNTTYTNGGAGGGAGTAATASVGNTTGARGGDGLYTSISGGATTGLGILSGGNYYFAGGGGGGFQAGSAPAVPLGGSAGVNTGTPNSGAAYSGAGGGGTGGNYVGGAGGSGIVIVRYTV